MADKSNFKRKKFNVRLKKAGNRIEWWIADERMEVLGRIVEDVLAEILKTL